MARIPFHEAASPLRVAACWAVHLYTACGALAAFAALRAIERADVRAAFLCMWIAVFIDSTDGALARLARVKEVLPFFDGSKLDDIVDYLTFVVVPLLLLVSIGSLSGTLGIVAAGGALLASAYRFCHADAKTADHFFTGFPSYWNIVALYLYVFQTPPLVNAAITLGLAALVFAPLRFLYPSRMTQLRTPTIALGMVWGAAVLGVVLALPERRIVLAVLSLLYPMYYTALSLVLQSRVTTRATR